MPQFDIFTIMPQVISLFFAYFGILFVFTYFYLPIIFAIKKIRFFYLKNLFLVNERYNVTLLALIDSQLIQRKNLNLKEAKLRLYLNNKINDL